MLRSVLSILLMFCILTGITACRANAASPSLVPPTATPSPPSAADFGQPFRMQIGQTVRVQGEALAIEFVQILSDTRCPKSIECFWSGEAVVQLEIRLGEAAPQEIQLSTLADKTSARVGDLLFQLLAVDPYPENHEKTILPGEYWITLTIERQ